MVRDLRIILIGYRGTGKTTVGSRIAEQLNQINTGSERHSVIVPWSTTALTWPFLDCDIELERHAGCSISQIFQESGEAVFRDLEEQTLERLLKMTPLVLSTGGGVIQRQTNRERLRNSGFVVWLQATTDEIWQRLQLDPSTGTRRPNLTQGGLAEVQELFAKREPLYRETASFALSTSGRSPDELATTILNEWRNRVAELPPPPESEGRSTWT
jgi:shikimate kinase